MATVQSFKTDVSSVSPLSELMEELWVVYLSAELGATLLVGNYKATTKKRDRGILISFIITIKR